MYLTHRRGIVKGLLFDKPTVHTLLSAVRIGDVALVADIITAGVDVNSDGMDGWKTRAIHVACKLDRADVVKLLVKAGARVDLTCADKYTPLHIATESGHSRVVEELLVAKPPLNAITTQGYTPLCIACKINNVRIVDLLLTAGANVNYMEPGHEILALNVAVRSRNLKVAKMLLDAKADPRLKDNNGDSSVHSLSRTGDVEMLGPLVMAGAIISEQNKQGLTPLMCAAAGGHSGMIQALLSAGADVNATNKAKLSALYYAHRFGNAHVVEVLLKNGATPIDPIPPKCILFTWH